MKTERKGEVNDNAERVSEIEATTEKNRTEKNRPEILLIKGFVRSLMWGHDASVASTLGKAARHTERSSHSLS